MTLVNHKNFHKYSGARIIRGAGLWDRVKSFTRRIFGSRQSKNLLKKGAEELFKRSPQLITKGLDWLRPKVPLPISEETMDKIQKATENTLKEKVLPAIEQKVNDKIDGLGSARIGDPALGVTASILTRVRQQPKKSTTRKPKISGQSASMIQSWM